MSSERMLKRGERTPNLIETLWKIKLQQLTKQYVFMQAYF